MAPLVTLALAGIALAADPGKPHPHQGIAPKFTAAPSPTALTAEEAATLSPGHPVLKQVKYEGVSGGRGVAIMDVAAPPDDVWAIILDFSHYPDWVDQLAVCSPYRESGDHRYVQFEIRSLGMSVEYFIDHTVHRDAGYVTWALDYSRESDLDDSVGYWFIRPHPDHAGWSRVEYTVDVRVASAVPSFIEDIVAKKGLRDATSWLPKAAEARAAPR